MVACEACGRSDQFLFYCEHCRGQYCDDHLRPGAHLCDEAPVITEIHERPRSSDTEQSSSVLGGRLPTISLPSAPIEAIRGGLPSVRMAAIVIFVVVAGASIGIAASSFGLLDRLPADPFELSGGGASDATVISINRTVVERDVAARLNEFRRNADVGTVTYDENLASIALYHSRDMADENYTGHVGPSGETVQDRFNRFGYACSAPSELVLFTEVGRTIETQDGSMRFETNAELASGILELWQQSDAHRQALLSSNWTRVGVGVIVTPEGRVYVTLNAC